MNKTKFYIRNVNFDADSPIGISYGDYKEYKAFLSPITDHRDVVAYGERISHMKVCTLRKSCLAGVKEGDVAYIETTPKEEATPGTNFDYVVTDVSTMNEFTKVIFEKSQKEVLL